jgi:AraC-like DNA-binding protein
MSSHKIYPSQQLAKYIDHYWWMEIDNAGSSEKILPDSSLEIIFHFGKPIARTGNNASLQQEPTSLLIGQTIKPYTILSTAKAIMLGIKFHLNTAKFFLDIPLQEMRDQYVALSDLWGSSIHLLQEELCNTAQLTEKISTIEKFLLKKLKPKTKSNLLVDDVLREMRSRNRTVCIKEICIRRHISTRYLEKLFMSDVGISPKMLARIFQFQYALQLLKTKSESLTHLGLEAGYFDQSHFIKNFKYFTDTTPAQFIHERFPMQESLLNPY